MNTKARQAIKDYHADLYAKNALYQKGTWLEKPEPEVIEVATKYFQNRKNVRVLDLGSGVGRNAISVAQIIGKNDGEVTCVDYLEMAIQKLQDNAKKRGLSDVIRGFVSDIESFVIQDNHYDFIIAHGVLNSTKSRQAFDKTVEAMKKGTKSEGIVYISMSTSVSEVEIENGKHFSGDIEVPFTTEEADAFFKGTFEDWKIIQWQTFPYEEQYTRSGKEALWTATFLSIVVQKK